jgi:hypothetical protein
MEVSKWTSAEVIDNRISFNRTIDNKTSAELSRGVIRVKFKNDKFSRTVKYAYPINPYDVTIPKIGEMVACAQFISSQASPFNRTREWYYINIINTFDQLYENKLVGIFDTGTPGSSNLTKGIQSNAVSTVTDDPDVIKLQPYEGDRILQSRFGSSIRFGSSNTFDPDIDYAASNPPWKGNRPDSPILMFTNGYETTPGGNPAYSIEDPNNDASLIYLTSDQKILLDVSQTKIGLGASPIKNYISPQIILSADRLVFNARNDYIVLSGGKSVNIATQNWAVNMDTFFSVVDDMKTQIDALQRELNNLTVQFQTLATGIQTFGIAQSAIAAATGILSPLAPAPATAGVTAGTVLGSTSPILSNLVKIKTDLVAISQTIATLKQ